tara:strand:- start:19496 stop:19627 length:132 start_codon:yes stop_codon:yes gene_type:complete
MEHRKQIEVIVQDKPNQTIKAVRLPTLHDLVDSYYHIVIFRYI